MMIGEYFSSGRELVTLVPAVVKPLILESQVSIFQVLVDSLTHLKSEVPKLLLRSLSQVLNWVLMEDRK